MSGQSTVSGAKGRKTWVCDTVEHKGFKDLGNYVIELPDYNDPSVTERARNAFNKLADAGPLPACGCTCMAKRNSKGEVILGRNMDLDISQSPGYIFKTTFGKYQNFCIAYSPSFYMNYAELQKEDELPSGIMDLLYVMACDCLNEKGLYIEMNLREKNEKLCCYGLHSSMGEKTREDGTPWSELRACTTSIPQLVSQNCATVQEAVKFLRNSYDWYTIDPKPNSGLAVAQNNMCFMIGDATGEYGLIEIAQDEVSYIPYQYGQANFYITPNWNTLDTYGAGYGRLKMVSKVIGPVDTLEEAMDAMKPIMWRNETLWIGESCRKTDGTRLHPYNQLCFQDDLGHPQMDWRGEYTYQWPVLKDGRMLIPASFYEEAKESTYDPKIKEYMDEAIATGHLVVDDGTYKFQVGSEEVSLTELADKYNAYDASADVEEKKALKPYHDVYWQLLISESSCWVHNDTNYEALKAAAYARLHIRYDANGKFDPTCLSKYEKLLAFYGYGIDKDETPLRDDGSIWTTSLNVGVNCAQKKLKVRFWENDNVIYEVGF